MAQVTNRVIIHDGPDGTKTMHTPDKPCPICDPSLAPVVPPKPARRRLVGLLEKHQWNGDDTVSNCTCGIFCPDIPAHQANLILEMGWRIP
jgi:hypothetical protein